VAERTCSPKSKAWFKRNFPVLYELVPVEEVNGLLETAAKFRAAADLIDRLTARAAGRAATAKRLEAIVRETGHEQWGVKTK
jgi:hypothetical protein